jgi:phosphoribosyl 1,2-cyclic phosphodiesterase
MSFPDTWNLISFAPHMSLFIASINSGSNGNCYYVGDQRDAVLIDAGISCRETEKRVLRMGLSFKKIKAIFISHEHTDHTRGVEVISRRHKMPVYISGATLNNSRLKLDEKLVIPLKAHVPFYVGGLVVNAFPKRHDAMEPFSFTVTGGGITIGIMTDIGSACEHVMQNFSRCHAAFLEANYDEMMLEEGRYPRFLKNRIAGDHGHLSNRQALDLFMTHKAPFLTHLLLSHLSQDNNDPQLVQDLFTKHARGTNIAIASRHEESSVFCISGSKTGDQSEDAIVPSAFPAQMTLFNQAL